LTPHPIAGVRVMCCLAAYEGIYEHKETCLKVVQSNVYLGSPEDNILLEDALEDIAEVSNKSEQGLVIIYSVKNIDTVRKLEKTIGFWIDGLYAYEGLIGIEKDVC